MTLYGIVFLVSSIVYCFSNAHNYDANYSPSLRLPSILTLSNGSNVTTYNEWLTRREEMKTLLDTYILGTKPSKIPSITSFGLINQTSLNGATSVYYEFGLDLQNFTSIPFELICPAASESHQDTKWQSTSLYPVVMTQYNHREWCLRLVQRNSMCCLRYPGSDTRDASLQFKYIYLNSNIPWGAIARRAWLASRIIDVLYQFNQSIMFIHL